jgi:hypothetical protein
MVNDKIYSPSTAASVLAAALLLPGVQAQAASAPENGSITLGYLDYRDSQSGLDRINVHAPSVSVLAPLAGVWAIGGTLVSDDVSGASPRYHSAVSGASRMSDHRTAADVAVTRYFERGSLQAGVAYSNERDYLSRALSLQGTLESLDKNTSWTVGLGYADDHINPVNNVVTGERRRTPSVLLGVTQVLGVNDIAQLTATYSQGDGYFSDPYKALDNRPRSRDQSTLLARWNHHLANGDTSRLSYRYYRDSFGIRAHTLGAEYVRPLANGWTATPELRLYTQSAASFYYDPVYDAVLGAPFPPGYQANPDGFRSADQRLSGFGAVTAALKVSKQLGKLWTVDAKAEYYQQRGSWRAFHDGSPGLAPLRARTLQIAVTRQW